MSKKERARLLAFYEIRGGVRSYQAHESELKKIDVDLVDWLSWDENTREFKIESARKLATV